MGWIAVYGQDGLVACAEVDDDDLERCQGLRWRFDKDGYVIAWTKGPASTRKMVKLHRYVLDAPTGIQVDHINLNKLDNRRANLRLATCAENAQNKAPRGRSGIRGVSWHKKDKCWRARATLNRKEVLVGMFKDINDAEEAIVAWRKANMPFSVEVGG